MHILSNVPSLIVIVPGCRIQKTCLRDCNVLVVIAVFDHLQGM